MEFKELSRRIYSSKSALSEIYYPWCNYVGQYKSTAVFNASMRQFSKIAAIRDLYQVLQQHLPAPGTEDLLRAFLTDKGLLFPQTRERGYPTNRSWRFYSTAGKQYHEEAKKRCDKDLSEIGRILVFAKEVYEMRQQDFEETYPLISFSRVEQGIHSLMDGREGPFYLQNKEQEYSLGVCKGDLSKINYDENPAEVEYIMNKWIRTTCFYWNGSEWISSEVIQKTLNFPTVELFEFLSEILPKCLFREAMQRKLMKTEESYISSINKVQLAIFQDQIDHYQKESLSQWICAFPVLGKYLHPDFAQFACGCTSGTIDSNDNVQGPLRAKLIKVFHTYCNRMEPISKIAKPNQVNETYHHMADWFLTATSNDSGPKCLLFSESPHLIFHLFRSPVHRYVYNYENRNWNLERVIKDAYARNQSVPAGGYRTLLSDC